MAPRIGIWHPGVSSNQGDRAIQQATISLIFRRHPEAEIVQFDADPEAGKRVYPDPRIRFVPLGFRHLAAQIRAIRGLDLLVWGGGSLVQQSSLLFLPYHLSRAALARFLRVPVVCFGSGVEPLRNPLLRRMARSAFERIFDDVLVRGRRSAATLRALGVERPIRTAADQVVTLPPAPPEEAAAFAYENLGLDPREHPCVSVSFKRCFLYRGGWLPVQWEARRRSGRRYEAHLRVQADFARLIRSLLDNHGLRVVLVPMYHSQGDLAVCRELMEEVAGGERVRLLEAIGPSSILKGLLGLMQAHVGIRLHSTILATSMGVPSICVYYMQKGLEYFEWIGCERFALPLDSVTWTALEGAWQELWERRRELRRHLLVRNRELSEQVLEHAVLLDRGARSAP